MTSTAASESSRGKRLSSRFNLTVICSLTSPGFLWVLVFSLAAPSSKPLFPCPIKVALLIKLMFLLAMMI
jgi:hypothetical protein